MWGVVVGLVGVQEHWEGMSRYRLVETNWSHGEKAKDWRPVKLVSNLSV